MAPLKAAVVVSLVIGLVIAGVPAGYFYAQDSSLASRNTMLNSQLAANATDIQQLLALNASIHVQIATLQRELASNQSDVTTLQAQVTSLQNQISTLGIQAGFWRDQAGNDSAILGLSRDTVWSYNESNTCTSGGSISVQCGSFGGPYTTQYPGYVVVLVSMPTPENDYVQVTWSSYGVSYNVTQPIDQTGRVAFAVLPTSNLMISIIFYGTVYTTMTYYY